MTLVAREIPEIRQIEDRAILDRWNEINPDHVPDEFIDKLLDRALLFKDAGLDWESYDFETESMDTYEALEYFDARGIDLRNEHGQPLKCFNWICFAFEIVAKGVDGTLPRAEEISLRAVENRLELEAKSFVRRNQRP